MIRPHVILAGLAVAALAGSLAQAQTSIDVAKITCEQYNLFKVTDPRNIAIWLSGYYHAKRGDTVVEVQQLEENANKVKEFCLANPKVTVMDAAEKIQKPNR